MLPWQWMLVEVTAAGRLSSLLCLPVEVTEVVVKTMPVHLDCVSSISPVSLLVHLAIRISDLLVAADPNRPHRLHRPLLVVCLLVVLLLVVLVVFLLVVLLLVVLVGGLVALLLVVPLLEGVAPLVVFFLLVVLLLVVLLLVVLLLVVLLALVEEAM